MVSELIRWFNSRGNSYRSVYIIMVVYSEKLDGLAPFPEVRFADNF